MNPATIRSSCSRRSLCCDVVPALRLLSPAVLSQSLLDSRRRRHVRALARSLPDDALAFLAHTAMQAPVDFDGSAGGGEEVGQDIDLDVDDADEDRDDGAAGNACESGAAYRGVIERNIYCYGNYFTVKICVDGSPQSVGSFPTVEEARAARDSALLSACVAAKEQGEQGTGDGLDARDFTNGERGAAVESEGGAAAVKQTAID